MKNTLRETLFFVAASMLDVLSSHSEITHLKYECTTRDNLARSSYYFIDMSLPRQEKDQTPQTT